MTCHSCGRRSFRRRGGHKFVSSVFRRETLTKSYRRILVTERSGGSGLTLRSDDLDSVGELYPEDDFRQLVVPVEATPMFLGGLGELEYHGERSHAPYKKLPADNATVSLSASIQDAEVARLTRELNEARRPTSGHPWRHRSQPGRVRWMLRRLVWSAFSSRPPSWATS
jgi:hypothetical protein